MSNKPADKAKVPVVPATSNKQLIQDAIKIGQDLIKKETTKAQTAMVMYRLLHEGGCDQEVIVDAFIKGASLTPMGARTYFYNCKNLYQGEQKLMQEKLAKEQSKSKGISTSDKGNS